jgi:Mg2+ and Co2+ transporter CorA
VNAGTVVSVAALLVSAAAAIGTFLSKRGETRVTDDANLRDDQREYIRVLQEDNRDLRARVSALEEALRAAGIPIPIPAT